MKIARGSPLDARSFLSVAVPIVDSVVALHASGRVHKGIRPSSILVNTVSDNDPSLDSYAIHPDSRGRPLWMSSGRPEEPLAYLAPEQSGRLNRSVDARSDLYSLGTVFYEMLTGQPPFEASTPIEWIHCHVAKQATPPLERAAVSSQLSAIVMKLLAKAAGDRYQTATGLRADLVRCHADLLETGIVVDFPLARQDISAHLLIPEKLYGREADIEKLTAALDRVASTGQSRMVLLAGHSGIGKSSIVEELGPTLAAHHGLFASGKFDQYKRNIPYASVAQAFQGLISGLLQLSEQQLEPWRRQLRTAVGTGGQLITSLIPELELVIGRQPAVHALSPREAQSRFQTVFREFVRVFAQQNHPLVLFLDDLQWLDAASLELLEYLGSSDEPRHMLLVGAYRSNEVEVSHPLAKTLEAIRVHKAMPLDEIHLGPLGLESVNQLVCGALHCGEIRAAALARLVHERARGNPFYAKQFLKTLADEGLIYFDHESSSWNWGLAAIESTSYGEGVLDLMASKISRLPPAAREAIAQLACLGGSVSPAIFSMVNAGDLSPEGSLAEAIRSGLVLQDQHSFRFLHDRVQEAAYMLIPPSERATSHLSIARQFVNGLSPNEIDKAIFDVVSQFQKGIELVSDPSERNQVAGLLLQAGQRAMLATDYATAYSYLASGVSLLAPDCWAQQYTVAFSLNLKLAECEFLSGSLNDAKDRLVELSSRAKGYGDHASATALQVTLYTAMDRSDDAIEACLQHLRLAGIAWTAKPSRAMAQAEYDALLVQLGDRSIESLLDLPPLSDAAQRSTLDVLTAVLPPAFFSDENFVCLVLCRMANLSLRNGNGDAAPLAFAYLGMVIGPHFGDYLAGFRFGTLGLDLVEKRGLDRYRARVYVTYGAHVLPWSVQIRQGPGLLRRAYDAASEVGDLTYAGFGSCTLVTSRLAGGDDLADVQAEAEARLASVVRAKFGLIVDIMTAQTQLIRALRGQLTGLTSFNDGSFDEDRFEHRLQANPSLAIAECWYWIRKMQARYLGGDYAAARTAAVNAERLIWTSSGHFEWAEYHFYAALARCADFDALSPGEREQRLAQIKQHQLQLSVWERHCPENFGDRSALIAAELARIEGRSADAMRQYEAAIQCARASRFIHNEALSNEVAGRFYKAQGLGSIADALLTNARACYLAWGAVGKVRELEQRYAALQGLRRPDSTPPSASRQLEHLDLGALIQTFEAVASESGIKQLVHRLMVIALEHAGAQRGLLILPQGDRLRIEAEARVAGGGVDVQVRQASWSHLELPETVLHYVTRTRRSVLIDDAQLRNEFSNDPYLLDQQSRSILCLPLVKQGELAGLLYLENRLAACVFTPARVAVLRLLASTAAVSLENATLEEKESLLREIHHRVKNNLQLISSLLSLQAARAKDPGTQALLAESRNRVRSMALVHENLYRAGNFARVPMARHIQSLCAQLQHAYELPGQRIGLEVQVEDIQLDLGRAISCGLVINELVSNALKHGFPAGCHGRIVVRFELVQDGRFCLNVVDDGVGLPWDVDPLQAESMGLQLVQDLTQQLNGHLTVDVVAGTSFSISFAADEHRTHRS